MRLREIGEDRLVEQLLPVLFDNGAVVLGAGDDCAVVNCPPRGNLQLLKTDCIVEGIHFTATSPPALVGCKAMARPLSDFAAMSGIPQFALVTLIVRAERTLDWTKKLYRGLEKAARTFSVAIVGGETSRIRGPAVVSVSLTGFVEKSRWISRAGGKANDELLVTGRLGGSFRGSHLKFAPRIEEARWLTKHFPIHAMMDLSDGLGADLPRLARASGLGFEVDQEAIPRHRGCNVQQAIGDGEDYELLLAVSPKMRPELQRRWRKRWSLELTRIGRLTREKSFPESWPAGYVHFE